MRSFFEQTGGGKLLFGTLLSASSDHAALTLFIYELDDLIDNVVGTACAFDRICDNRTVCAFFGYLKGMRERTVLSAGYGRNGTVHSRNFWRRYWKMGI